MNFTVPSSSRLTNKNTNTNTPISHLQTFKFNSVLKLTRRGMFAKKVNPFAKKRSQHGVVSLPPNANSKKLWKLPHVFAKMLELPFPSDADVSIEETPHFFRFVASCNKMNMFNGNAGGVRAHAFEILPGITKIVIKRIDGGDVAVAGKQQHASFGVDLWRFRLPPWTKPEMVTAVCTGGKLVVTVPKTKGN